MKGKALSAIGLIALIIGVAIIIWHKSITSVGVVVTGGILFVAVGVANLIIFGQNSKENRGMARAFNQITNAAAIVLGICMLVFQSTFSPLVPFIFGLLVAVCALWQFFLLAVGTRPYILPGWHYLFPLILTAGAIYIFLQKTPAEHLIMLITGIAFALLGIGCFIEGSFLGVARRHAKKTTELQQPAPQPKVQEPKEAEEHAPEEPSSGQKTE